MAIKQIIFFLVFEVSLQVQKKVISCSAIMDVNGTGENYVCFIEVMCVLL